MNSIEAKWNKYWLSWTWSGEYWYVTAIDRLTGDRLHEDTPVGCGDTKDLAFKEFHALLMEQGG